MARVKAASAATGARSRNLSAGGTWPGCGACPSGAGFQKTSAQIFVMENKVSNPTAKATTAKTVAHQPNMVSPAKPAFTTANLAKNPESGGIPPSDMAGMKNNSARSGVAA